MEVRDPSAFWRTAPIPDTRAWANAGYLHLKLAATRHPERSASQTYRVTQCLVRGVEGPRGRLSYPRCSEFFNHRNPHRADPLRSFPGDENQGNASTSGNASTRKTKTDGGDPNATVSDRATQPRVSLVSVPECVGEKSVKLR
jgi:hypothetical protein